MSVSRDFGSNKYLDRSTAHALRQLGVLLLDYNYTAVAREAILAYTAREGTPSGCEYLDREDEADAEMVFVGELEAIPYDDPRWGPDEADYAAWAERYDALNLERRMEDEADPRYGYE